MASNLSYGPKAVTENLVLCLDANNVKSHSGGTAWYDLSSRANNATLTNGPVFNSSDSTTGGAYFDFDGTNDYATISSPSFAANGFIGGMTCEAWLKFDTASLLNYIKDDTNSFQGIKPLGVAYNPYLVDLFLVEELRRLKSKLVSGLVGSIWIQFGTNYKLPCFQTNRRRSAKDVRKDEAS